MCAAAPSEAEAPSVNTDVGLVVHMTEPELTYSVGRVHRCCRAPRARSAVHQEREKTEAAALLGQPAATRKHQKNTLAIQQFLNLTNYYFSFENQ